MFIVFKADMLKMDFFAVKKRSLLMCLSDLYKIFTELSTVSDTRDEHRTFPMDKFLESYGKEHVSILPMKNETVILSKVFVQLKSSMLIPEKINISS